MTTTRFEVLDTSSEADFTDTVIAMAMHFGWLVHHDLPARRNDRWVTSVQGHVGFPDLVCAKDGVVVFLELKSVSGRLTQEQRAWLAAVSDGNADDFKVTLVHDENGGLCRVVASAKPRHIDDIRKGLETQWANPTPTTI